MPVRLRLKALSCQGQKENSIYTKCRTATKMLDVGFANRAVLPINYPTVPRGTERLFAGQLELLEAEKVLTPFPCLDRPR